MMMWENRMGSNTFLNNVLLTEFYSKVDTRTKQHVTISYTYLYRKRSGKTS
jgi:hypothetical protein